MAGQIADACIRVFKKFVHSLQLPYFSHKNQIKVTTNISILKTHKVYYKKRQRVERAKHHTSRKWACALILPAAENKVTHGATRLSILLVALWNVSVIQIYQEQHCDSDIHQKACVRIISFS